MYWIAALASASVSFRFDKPGLRDSGVNRTSTRTVTRCSVSCTIRSRASRPSYPRLTKAASAGVVILP